MNPKKWCGAILALALAALAGGCGGGSTGAPVVQPQSGMVFVSGTDASLPSVVSFQVDITGLTVSDGVNPPVSILSNTQTVDFARLNGLQTLLDINTIPAGTYTSVTATLANPAIMYLDVTNPQTTPPTIATLNGSSTPPAVLTQSSVTIPLSTPLVVSMGNVIGLRFEFDIRHSVLQSNGQITGMVNPMLNLKAITPSDADAYIDDFVAGVVSADVAGNSFIIQGPHGHQFTVNVNGQTEWENGETLSDLTNTSIVAITGTLDKTAGTFLADSVAILSQNSFHAGGLITFVNPATGPATSFDLYVRDVLPSGTGFTSGQISTIDLTGNEKYFIQRIHNPFTTFFFNPSLLVPGQHVSIGGPFSDGTVTVKRVVLRHEGHTGAWVVGSTDLNNGTFQFDSNGLAGVLFNGPITVYTSSFTTFKGGLTGLSGLTGNSPIPLRVVGLILKDPISGQPLFVARTVEELTD